MTIYLYDEATCASLRPGDVGAGLRRISGLEAQVRPNFLTYWLGRDRQQTDGLGQTAQWFVEAGGDSVAAVLVRARVSDPMARLQPDRTPSKVELAAERRALESPGRTSAGILYDGAVLQWMLSELIQPEEDGDCHIVLTARLVGTWAPEDRRWHAHASLYGRPSLISTSGLVQAPARPREYYQGQRLAASRMVPREVVQAELHQRLRYRMLVADDLRLTQVVTGYALQALAFHVTGSPFCPVPTCHLYNARRQEELIRAQCSDESGLCEAHQALFDGLREGAGD